MSQVESVADGLHPGVPFAEYARWSRLNGSALAWSKASMLHVRECLAGRLPLDSTALRFGRAFHCRILEPDVFPSAFPVAFPCMRPLKSGPRKGEPCGSASSFFSAAESLWTCGTHVGPDSVRPVDYVSLEELKEISAMAASVESNKIIRLLRLPGAPECSVAFTMEGVAMKARLDKYLFPTQQTPGVVVDFKKVPAGEASDADFARSILRYGYDVKAALYVDAVALVRGGPPPQFVWIVVEDGHPFQINLIRANRETLAIGRGKYRRAVREFARCVQRDSWPSYCEGLHSGGLPENYILNHADLMEFE